MQAGGAWFTLVGIEAVPIEVQVSADGGYPQTTIVGLPDTAVRESLDRVNAAFRAAGFGTPDKRITVNLAPAELRKEGSALDLAIALGMLAALARIPAENLRGIHVAGELSLDGRVRPVRGALAMALALSRCGGRTLVVPRENVVEAASVPGGRVAAADSLDAAVQRLRAGRWIGEDGGAGEPIPADARVIGDSSPVFPDLAEIRGQAAARRALEIAAAGGHNLLLFGPPGAGKTLLAQRLPTILPPLSRDEALEATLVHSVAGLLPPGSGLLNRRPFRAPHHTITAPGLVGGRAVPRPGEVSLAHGGVLFLDEMPEFRSAVLNLLRQPVEDGTVRIVRAGRTVEFPCRFMLVGAMNPCMCGFLGHPRRPCRCTPHQVRVYRNRLSGPLLDRIDMHVEVPVVTARELTRGVRRGRAAAADPAVDLTARSTVRSMATRKIAVDAEPESSASVRARVIAARRVQVQRFAGESIHCNAQMGIKEIERYCRVDDATRALLHKAMETRSMSARAVHRVLRVARTIADLAGADEIALEQVAEAVQYQTLDRAGESG